VAADTAPDASEFNAFERVFDIGIPEQVAVRFQRMTYVTSTFHLAVVPDGTPADPPAIRSAVPN
jgi:hypothetical protein